MKYVDIVMVKAQADAGKLSTKLDIFDNILLEDTLAGEAVKIGKLPDGYSFHPKGHWSPCYIHIYNGVNNYMEGNEGYVCSNCGRSEWQKYDWCTCGADMRESKKPSKALKEFVDTL